MSQHTGVILGINLKQIEGSIADKALNTYTCPWDTLFDVSD